MKLAEAVVGSQDFIDPLAELMKTKIDKQLDSISTRDERCLLYEQTLGSTRARLTG